MSAQMPLLESMRDVHPEHVHEAGAARPLEQAGGGRARDHAGGTRARRLHGREPRGKHGQVVYDLRGDFGIEPADVRKRFDCCVERFPVRREE